MPSDPPLTQAQALRRRAARYRVVGATALDDQARRAAGQLADELEQEADAIERNMFKPPIVRPDGSTLV